MRKFLIIAVAAVFVIGGYVTVADATMSGRMSSSYSTFDEDCPYYEWPQTRCKFIPKIHEKVVLRGIEFDTASARIRPESYFILDETLRRVKQSPRRPVIIIGHTDSRGRIPYNMKLSLARAMAVRNFFVENGIAPWRVTAIGVGEADPVASNRSFKGRALNRRIEVGFKTR